MTEISLKVPVVGSAAETTSAREREVFLPRDARRQTLFSTLRKRLRWPLGIYTTPVVILIAWETLSRAGVLAKTYAPAPTSIVKSTTDLWQQGVLGPDLAISLQRAGIGLAIGLTVGIVTGVLGGLLRSGEHLFNGVVQVLNTIPILAVLPLMIVWFGIDELTKVLLIAFGAGVPMYLNRRHQTGGQAVSGYRQTARRCAGAHPPGRFRQRG